MVKLKTLVAAAALTAVSLGAANAEIKIATVGPLTGPYAAFGEQMKRGLEKAVIDLNAAGGVLGQKIAGSAEDDACDPKQAVAVANKLSSAGVALVAGHFCSGSSIPASSVYADEGILQISPASTNPALTDGAAEKGWKNVFRVCGRDDAQGIVAGKFLASQFKGKKVAVLHDKTAYGKGLADETLKNLRANGGDAAMYEAYTAGEKDYSALVSKMKAAGIDALVTDEYWKITGGAGEGTLMTFQPDPRKKPEAKAVVDAFRKDNYEPEGYTLYTYAAVQVWAQAATQANSLEMEKVAAKIRGGSFNTVIGTLNFDDKGDVKNPEYVWYVWKDGKYGEQ